MSTVRSEESEFGLRIHIQAPNQQAAGCACGCVSELAQALHIQGIRGVWCDSASVVTVQLQVSPDFSRAPILAMFAGLEQYWLDRAGLDALAAEVKP